MARFSTPVSLRNSARSMLNLQSTSSSRWLDQVDSSLEEILIDHAHCEHKAAATAMSLMGGYIENQELCREMTLIVEEELEHFHLVIQLLKKRGIAFQRQQPGNYGKSLKALVRPNEPQRVVDRLLVAGIIEARSCERFNLLAEHVQDAELAEFYRSLFESEARHHTTYVRLAKQFADDATVKQRLRELASQEAEIIAQGSPLPRMHS
ncbi:tRNA-(ms[2]io[6]A)-hydroxylase [Aureliella helgolandensis]|uniref:tRNA-(MS[2]IO[6]A)-hydroxylase (MiaE) n=1 Tax=Aureliella helgolandensis TaxID=2527968 RepID=A0A518GFM5_9BACT|nr:tRNA-(ms[2]io[6]A)-hydroxylase [Aureliella helgolandensis]QDV27401.1 tRNA-(MS[2]IO[6]A)-hydroxylase (MiaE) [Aureliella helgolandensis]